MASWILLLLLFCCGNNGMSDCGCQMDRDSRNRCDSDRDSRNRCDSDRDSRNRCDSDREAVRDSDCNCRAERRAESRLEPRPFTSFSGSSCGCEETRSNRDCDCGQ